MHELEDDSGKDNYEPSDSIDDNRRDSCDKGALGKETEADVCAFLKGDLTSLQAQDVLTLLLTNQTLTALNLVTSPCW